MYLCTTGKFSYHHFPYSPFGDNIHVLVSRFKQLDCFFELAEGTGCLHQLRPAEKEVVHANLFHASLLVLSIDISDLMP